jgi:hypothetical protein
LNNFRGLQFGSGDTTFNEAKKGFEKEMTPAQRKAAIMDLQTQTNWEAE